MVPPRAPSVFGASRGALRSCAGMNPAPPATECDRISGCASLRSRGKPAGLEELADRLAQDAEADHARAFVDLADRFGRHEPAAAQEARADGECVRDVGL